MPKLKTHKSTAKRFKITGTGKVMMTHAGKSHLRRRKSKRNRRGFNRRHELEGFAQSKKVKALAPTLDQT